MKRFFGKRAVLTALMVVALQLTASLVTRASVFNCSTDSFKCTSQGTCTGDLYVRSSCSITCYNNVQNIEQPGQIEPSGSSATCGSPVPTPTNPGGGGGTGPIGGGGGGWDGGWGGGGLWDPCDPFWYADYDAVACDAWWAY